MSRNEDREAETTLDSVSERTLHSLNLSCNGKAESPQENLSNGSNETLQKQQQQQQQQQQTEQTPVVLIDCLNGEKNNVECEQQQQQQLTAAKKPSYLGLACSISGYSGITRYDSKLREGFRSRDSSPGSRLITRETSPAGFSRSSESLGVPGLNPPTKSQSISPLAMDRQNGFSNGTKECKIENFVETRSSTISSYQGFSEVDRGLQLHTNFADISPIRATSPVKRTTGTMQIGSSYSRETKTYTSSISISSPRSTQIVSNTSLSDTSFVNGSSLEDNQTINNSSCSEKSFIQQRVERLYGPGALAQGFFFKRGSANGNTSETSFNKSSQNSNNNDKSIDNANTEESLKNLPVLRHLRPEFRAQLPVVSPRKATDGSEQVIKPLQRISVTPQRKNDTNAKIPTSIISSCNSRENESIKLSASVTSIPDQQPAAPEVVLPVLETSPSSTSIAATEQAIEPVDNSIEEKHGHHFMRLLNAERDRLLLLAESAEAELAKADPATLPEEAEGKLRSAAGKARLLAKQKMQQFEGLCHKNISQVPGEKFPTTYEDLAGFWDMVMLQVVQVNEIFAQIEKLKSSQWQEVRGPDWSKKVRKVRRKSVVETMKTRENPEPQISKLRIPRLKNPCSVSENFEKSSFPVDFMVQRCTSIISKTPSDLLEKYSPKKSRKMEKNIFPNNLKENKSSCRLTGLNKFRARRGCVEKPKLTVHRKFLTDPELKKFMTQFAVSKSKKWKKIEFFKSSPKSLEILETLGKLDKFTETENCSVRLRKNLAKFSRVIDVWSNSKDYEGNRSLGLSSSISVASQCPVWSKLKPRKALKDLRKRKIVEDVVSSLETKKSIVWSNSQAISRAEETPNDSKDSKQCYEPFLSTSKLERMKKYDTRRKKLFEKKRLENKCTKDEENRLQLIKRDYEFFDKKNCDFNVYFVAPKIWSHESFLRNSKNLGAFRDKDFRQIIDVDDTRLMEIKKNYDFSVSKRPFENPQLSGVKNFFTFLRTNRNFCRLSLYIYSYGMLSLVLIFIKLTSCITSFFYDPYIE